MPQVTTKVATVDLVGEGGGDDADRQGDHDKSNEDRDRCDDASRHGHRNDIAVTDRPKRDDGPPHRVGNGAEFVGLCMTLDQVHDACGQQRCTQQNHEAAEQGAALVVENIQERAHGG
jgi:hypothetical protein